MFSLVIVLLAGLLAIWLARSTGIPEALFVLLAGAFLHELSVAGRPLVLVPFEVIAMVVLVSRAFLAFEYSVLAAQHRPLLKHWLLVALEVVVMAVAGRFVLGIDWWFASVFGAIVTTTAMHGRGALMDALNRHAVITGIIASVVPWIVLGAFAGLEEGAVLPFGTHLAFTAGDQLLGIGIGIFTAFVLLRILKRMHDWYASLAVLVGILFAYLFATVAEGSGILAVVALGVFFGLSTVRDKVRLFSSETHAATVLLVLVFAFVGFVVKFDAAPDLLFKSFLLFLLLMLFRMVALSGGLVERLFGAFHAGPGAIGAAVLLSLIVDPGYGGLALLLRAAFVILMLGLLSQTVTSFFSRRVLGETAEKPL